MRERSTAPALVRICPRPRLVQRRPKEPVAHLVVLEEARLQPVSTETDDAAAGAKATHSNERLRHVSTDGPRSRRTIVKSWAVTMEIKVTIRKPTNHGVLRAKPG